MSISVEVAFRRKYVHYLFIEGRVPENDNGSKATAIRIDSRMGQRRLERYRDDRNLCVRRPRAYRLSLYGITESWAKGYCETGVWRGRVGESGEPTLQPGLW